MCRLDEKNALKEINKINKDREKHYNYYTHEKWRDINNYDLVINVDDIHTPLWLWSGNGFKEVK